MYKVLWDFKYYGSPLEGFRQENHIIILYIYEPSGSCVKNELGKKMNWTRARKEAGRQVTTVVQARDDGNVDQADGG